MKKITYNEQNNELNTSPNNITFQISSRHHSSSHIHYYAELLYVISGKHKIMVNQRPFTAIPGDFILLLPNEIHKISSITHGQILHIHFLADTIPQFGTSLTQNSLKMNLKHSSDLSIASRTAILAAQELALNCSDFHDNSDTSGCSGTAQATIKEGLLLIFISDMISSNLTPRMTFSQNEYCQAAVEYIEQHYHEEISLGTIAYELGINQSYLSRLFSSQINVTCSEYIANRRLDYAKALILSSCKSITNIMLEAGFKSERTFYRRFKQRYGFTPSELRTSYSA